MDSTVSERFKLNFPCNRSACVILVVIVSGKSPTPSVADTRFDKIFAPGDYGSTCRRRQLLRRLLFLLPSFGTTEAMARKVAPKLRQIFADLEQVRALDEMQTDSISLMPARRSAYNDYL